MGKRLHRSTVSRRLKLKTLRYTIVIHRDEHPESGYWAEVPSLPGCFTQGESIEQCMENAQEAITGYLEALTKLGEPIPEEPERENAVISMVEVKLRVPA